MNQQALHQVWYGGKAPGPALKALEKIYAWGSARQRRRAARAACPELVGKPIIVVGNLAAGGTGKTPVVMYLCRLLGEAGLAVAVISRGYGRSGRGQVQVSAATPVHLAGDEPAMIARRCTVPVIVDSNREAAARSAFAGGAQVVIADDGLQRLSLPRRLEICVVDGERGFGNRHLLPAGPLREPLQRLQTVDYVICNGGQSLAERSDAISLSLQPDGFIELDGGAQLGSEEIRARASGRPLHAVAGIGNPGRFFNSLRELGLAPDECHAFSDHHRYRADDFKAMQGYVLMTEKDAVKCAELAGQGALPPAAYLRVSAALPEGFSAALLARVNTMLSESSA